MRSNLKSNKIFMLIHLEEGGEVVGLFMILSSEQIECRDMESDDMTFT